MTKTEALSKLQLNPRLAEIARLIPPCTGLADIGTDHGYIPIFGILSGVAERAVASDINRGPVKRAHQNVLRHGLEDRIDLRLGGGLSTVEAGEAEVIVIAGMGGILISDILRDAKAVANSARYLILQPMTAAKELREYLCQNSFAVEKEVLVAEEDKIYNIICVRPGGKSQYSLRELYLGKNIDEEQQPLFEENRRRVREKFKKRLAGLEKSTREESKKEADEVRRVLDVL